MAVALVALFVALGGTSYAVSRIDGRHLMTASVSGKKLKRNTLGTREIRESSLAKVPAAVRADRATSAGVAGTLTDAAAASLTVARSAADPDDRCHPADSVSKPFLDCASVTVALPRAGRVLLVGTAGVAKADTNVPFSAGCQLEADDGAVTGSLAHGGEDFDTTPGMHFADTPFGIATTAVTPVMAAGAHVFALACQQTDPDALVVDAKISAVMIGAG